MNKFRRRKTDVSALRSFVDKLSSGPLKTYFLYQLMSITIDGNDVSNITIDGDQVQEVTIDGNVAWSAAEEVIDSVESGGNYSWSKPNDVSQVDVLVVGGGGGGGQGEGGGGGGGGAGGVAFANGYSISGDVEATVGTGGAGADLLDSTGESGYNGVNSSFGGITAKGGGGGSAANDNTDAGDGGSGGGGSDGGDGNGGGMEGLGNQPNTNSNANDYGNDGGKSTSNEQGGGGGGASQAGETDGSHSGDGGNGKYYGDVFADSYGDNGYFGGGGGGGSQISDGGAGGLGGGGRGTGDNWNKQGGVDGTGGGGGAGSKNGTTTEARKGGDGGDGAIIVKYQTANPAQGGFINEGLSIDSFENDNIGSPPALWNVQNAKVTDSYASDGSRSVRNKKEVTTSFSDGQPMEGVVMTRSISDENPSQITFAYRETSDSGGIAYAVRNSNGERILLVGTGNPQVGVKYGNNNSTELKASPSPSYGEWRRFTITFDWENNQFDVLWEDVTGNSSNVSQTGLNFYSNSVGISQVVIGSERNIIPTGANAGPNGYEWLDEVWGV